MRRYPTNLLPILALLALAGSCATATAQSPAATASAAPETGDGAERNRLLPPSENNPRNSEGDFIELADGRVLFVYTHFTGNSSDHGAAHLAGRFSSDGGRTWTDEDVRIVDNEGDMNVMSVSLLRLESGEIALFYLVKNSLKDCRPWMRVSRDEARTWSEPRPCVDEPGYNVLNNDRAVQLKSGRIVLPVALHPNTPNGGFAAAAQIHCHYSDDGGETWQVGQTAPSEGATLQEPGVVELADGREIMFCRTPHGSQYLSYSSDDGETWTSFEPSDIQSPLSPATIERIPSTGDLLLVWNNHADVDPALRGLRTPFNAAISSDEGRSWKHIKTLEDDPNGWYCYTAMAFVDGHVLLGHCAGHGRGQGLNTTQITRFPIAWLYP